ncbi:MAG: CpsD/CapB family tyrosine-protein kinase [Acholeplasmataceae bacterium]
MQKADQKNHQDMYKAISHSSPNHVVTEQYRKLRTNIELSNFGQEIKVIALTSTLSEEGKTVTSINLATVYAQGQKKTLLIDMDLRKPKIHRGFNLLNKVGLSDIITNAVKKEDSVHKISDYLDVLTAGSKLPYPAEFLMSSQLNDLVNAFRADYDRIIIDTPPMAAVTDANIISSFVDGVILVVGSRKTNIEVAKNVTKDLKSNGANIIGSVLTMVKKKDNAYQTYYSYKENKKDKQNVDLNK